MWTTQDIQKEMFFLERAARALDGFQGHFTQYMAKRVGARFSTDPLPEHWDEWLL